MIPSSDDPSRWREALLAVIRRDALAPFDRVEVLRETASTQDDAARLAAGRPGLVVLAERQTSGRGRLGRQWEQRADLGLAMTLVVASGPVGMLSLAAGLAAARALDGIVPAFYAFGLRWPNDVVEPMPRGRGGGRKIAGVLIEARGDSALIGVGVNVYQHEEDFSSTVRGRAVSVRQLGSLATRIDVATSVVRALSGTLCMTPPALVREWMQRDVLTGSRQAFMHAGRRVEGLVESIDPSHEIIVRTDEGAIERLPAMTTSLVHA